MAAATETPTAPMSPQPNGGAVALPPSTPTSPTATVSVLRPRERTNSTEHHPYAIKTTSTALLTRSNSTGSRPISGHSYAPKGHQRGSNSRGGSIDGLPTPLPMPPSPARSGGNSPSKEEFSTGGLSRSSTLPNLRSGDAAADDDAEVVKRLALPENPKLWTPSHLATYLTQTLRFKGEAHLPARIAQDLSHFVFSQKLTGRVFLRLTDSDLNDMEVNTLWREALLNSSRSLRKRVLQGRIWGFGSSPLNEEDDRRGSMNGRRFPSTVNEADEQHATEGDGEGRRTSHIRTDSAGRVRMMAASFERTGSSDSGPRRRSSVSRASDSEEEISSASDVSDLSDNESAAQPPTPDGISAPDVAIVVAPSEESKPTISEPSVEDLLAGEGEGDSGPAVKGWDFDTDGENENPTARRLVLPAPATNSRAGSRKGTAKSRVSTIGRKNGAPLADLFRDAPEPPVELPTIEQIEPPASASEVAELRARVADLEARVEALLQRDEETRALLAAKEAETAHLLAESRAAHEQAQRERASTDAETKRLLEEHRLAQIKMQVDLERARDEARREKATELVRREEEERKTLNPAPTQLPAYIALVGVGLCAVIVRSMLNKFSGRR